ncbi:MAG: hypothetical protein CO029_00910 [Candidatus Magasanikbacteria bacterium CG_4_9_14_0_2_um_filter_41_10]|uniref:Uncharacterized protein n=1 Tax=Candidatus Magasanikbacteria bacterium CG_4_10_14_0_2_um_filter_41_31 TaxID=1974639 RepID=A0A2M7V1S2_9BACT|nr:MAG: hypothetical protein AUJ37_04150 [Candidatus Magasanikbacteria bacterium CG1_02_41_34]PIZ92285.1 MAG: hypothetical protein COX83_04765 [Candidatus Magasanikbacteria bacterium CG_4_10_14_0_2_um_filter_41_31]PJC53771.1 MAG: hypothetical protein CO029_00910 [Candidatus Magasanikbacteria bacterium CG_4_9_14_0_2_um_filter_41_10]
MRVFLAIGTLIAFLVFYPRDWHSPVAEEAMMVETTSSQARQPSTFEAEKEEFDLSPLYIMKGQDGKMITCQEQGGEEANADAGAPCDDGSEFHLFPPQKVVVVAHK